MGDLRFVHHGSGHPAVAAPRICHMHRAYPPAHADDPMSSGVTVRPGSAGDPGRFRKVRDRYPVGVNVCELVADPPSVKTVTGPAEAPDGTGSLRVVDV
jgi:hypothetical protein